MPSAPPTFIDRSRMCSEGDRPEVEQLNEQHSRHIAACEAGAPPSRQGPGRAEYHVHGHRRSRGRQDTRNARPSRSQPRRRQFSARQDRPARSPPRRPARSMAAPCSASVRPPARNREAHAQNLAERGVAKQAEYDGRNSRLDVERPARVFRLRSAASPRLVSARKMPMPIASGKTTTACTRRSRARGHDDRADPARTASARSGAAYWEMLGTENAPRQARPLPRRHSSTIPINAGLA